MNTADLYPALNMFQSIHLSGLDDVKLLNRIDTKFVFHASYLNEILEEIKEFYYILEIDNKRFFEYESLYFDTKDYDLYKYHHNGKLNRLKIRYRKYLDSGLCFFEVKYKIKGTRTDKKRLLMDSIHSELGEAEKKIIQTPLIDANDLQEKLWIRFQRITLASKLMNERLTIDVRLSFDNFTKKIEIPEIVVAEIKTEKTATKSPILRSFLDRHFEKMSFSKYSNGIALIENIKNNNFRPTLLRLHKIIQNGRKIN